MPDPPRRVVVKIGSRALVDDAMRLDPARITAIATDLATAREHSTELILVSSGAVAAGLPALNLLNRPHDLPRTQAAAAIGQASLMQHYRDAFSRADTHVAQLLLTHADLRHRERQLNARHTLSALLQHNIIPIINENDTVAVDELRFGDNDRLAALVCLLVDADLLILLTNTDGLLDTRGEIIPRVTEITTDIRALVQSSATDQISTGGMASKLDAAAIVTAGGETAIIANARTPDIITRLIQGASLGTRFDAQPRRMASRKRWIAFFNHPRGDLHVDDGAARALRDRNTSLLAVGITGVRGDFSRGDVVRIFVNSTPETEVARGIVNYPAREIAQMRGRTTNDLLATRGPLDYDEVIHRDNLVIR